MTFSIEQALAEFFDNSGGGGVWYGGTGISTGPITDWDGTGDGGDNGGGEGESESSGSTDEPDASSEDGGVTDGTEPPDEWYMGGYVDEESAEEEGGVSDGPESEAGSSDEEDILGYTWTITDGWGGEDGWRIVDYYESTDEPQDVPVITITAGENTLNPDGTDSTGHVIVLRPGYAYHTENPGN